MFDRFGLVLVVNHACNLRCSYCYTGEKLNRLMPTTIGKRSNDRAVASLQEGGTLELGFFGGEALVEAALVAELIHHAELRCAARRIMLQLSLTTNGTITTRQAWEILRRDDLELFISHDGLPEVHDRHRKAANGQATSHLVEQTIARLRKLGKCFRVVMVVRPDNVDDLVNGIAFLRENGVTGFDPSLDLWSKWSCDDVRQLEKAVALAGLFWQQHLPDISISWFDEKAAEIAQVMQGQTARCGFGAGEIAIAPSGRLYPCERLVGEDDPANPMRLSGHALDGDDFLSIDRAPAKSEAACSSCAMDSMCNTTCRCSNYIRTGDVRHPDGLLCSLNKACLIAAAKALAEMRVEV